MTSLYRHFDAHGRLLYVGISESVWHRQTQHMGAKDWSKQIAFIQVEHHDTRAQALAAESEAIRLERPAPQRPAPG